MTIKIGINGMGRIGRMVLRSILENYNKRIEIKHINNRTGPEICSQLIKYDSIHGKLGAEIKFDDKHLIIGNITTFNFMVSRKRFPSTITTNHEAESFFYSVFIFICVNWFKKKISDKKD